MQELKEVRNASSVKPSVNTLGMERNIYALIGRVSQTLQASGLDDRAKQFVHESMSLSGYDELLALSQSFVQFEGEGIVSTNESETCAIS